MAERKKGFLEKFLTSSSKKDGKGSWRVVLKGVPDKQVEGLLVQLLTDRLNAAADDATKIVQAVPIILFSNLTSHEAEQIKLRLNETGARTAISNDPDELKGFAMVSWPKKVSPQDLVDVADNFPAPPPFFPSTPLPSLPSVSRPSSGPGLAKSAQPVTPSLPKPRPSAPIPPNPPIPSSPESRPREKPVMSRPIIPLRPSAPAPPSVSPAAPVSTPLSEDWRTKYETLQKSHLEILSKLEKKEMDLKLAQDRMKSFTQGSETLEREKEQLRSERERLKVQCEISLQEIEALKMRLNVLEQERAETLGGLRREIQQHASTREVLQREISALRGDRENLLSELTVLLEGVKAGLESRIAELMIPVEPLKFHLKKVDSLLDAFRRPEEPPSPERSDPGPEEPESPPPPVIRPKPKSQSDS